MLLEVLQGTWDIFAGLADTAETAAFWNSSWRAGRRPEGILTAAGTCFSAAEFHTKSTRKPKLIKHSHYGVYVCTPPLLSCLLYACCSDSRVFKNELHPSCHSFTEAFILHSVHGGSGVSSGHLTWL